MAAEAGFAKAVGAGLSAAFAVGIGLFLTVLSSLFVDDSGLLFALLLPGALMFAFMGAAFTGTLIGLAAGRWSSNNWSGAGAGAVAGLLGQLLVLAFTFTPLLALDFSGATEESSDIQESDFDTSLFIQGVLFLTLPALVAGAVAGGIGVPSPVRGSPSASLFPTPTVGFGAGIDPMGEPTQWSTYSMDAEPMAEPLPEELAEPWEPPEEETGVQAWDAPETEDAGPDGPTRTMRCPQCQEATEVPDRPGSLFTCPSCGLDGRVP